MGSWQSPADLVRWWRSDVLGLSQRSMAERLGVARTTVTNWERGTRLASVDIDRLAPVLADLLWALEAPSGLAPRRVWSKVFRGPSSPVWMWVRSSAESLTVSAEWGMYRVETSGPIPANGRFVTVGASADDSPLVVVLSEPGTVEFGRGVLPERIPDAEVFDAVELMQPSSASGDAFNDLLSAGLAASFERPDEHIGGLDDPVLRPLASFLDEIGSAEPGGAARPPRPDQRDGVEGIDRSDFARLREARRLSLGETVARLLARTGVEVGKDTLRRFEQSRGVPHDELLPVALDQILGGNGYLAMHPVRAGRGPDTIRFPDFWNAPVWLEFGEVDPAFAGLRASGPSRRPPAAVTPEDSGAAGTQPQRGRLAELEWSGWRRTVEGDGPLAVTIHGAPRTLRVVTDRQWVAGVGRRVDAVPIDHGWLPASLDDSQQAISEYRDILVEAFRVHRERRRRRDDQP